jgi:hypothetical protein
MAVATNTPQLLLEAALIIVTYTPSGHIINATRITDRRISQSITRLGRRH